MGAPEFAARAGLRFMEGNELEIAARSLLYETRKPA
jgi:hypothetical protein